MGRNKKPRTIELDIHNLNCHCFGPMDLCGQNLDSIEHETLLQDELQSIIYQDVDQLTMSEACAKMGVSKTVYAGIYQQARSKLAYLLLNGTVLKVCTKTS